jgi:hypothetical protein
MKKKTLKKNIIEGRWYNINKKIKKKLQQNITKLKIGEWIQKAIF